MPTRTIGPPPPRYNSMVASAEIIRGAKLDERRTESMSERNLEVRRYYDTLGEFTFGVTWFANTLSRLRICAATPMLGGEEPTILTDGLAAELVAQVAGGIGGQARLLWGCGNFLPMTGDMYMVGDTGERSTSWRSYPPECIRTRGRRGNELIQIQVGDSAWVDLPPDTVINRIWREDPWRWWRSQAPARTALPIMNELELINRNIIATLQSRLAGAGILVVPTEITFAPSPAHADAPDPFVAELMDTMITPIKDPGSASAVVPMVVRLPATYAEALKHINFETLLERKILNLRESAIQRLATTLDLPAEVLLGLGGTNHWTAWQITEEAFKTHVAPAIELVCDAFTTGYLRPALAAIGQDPDSAIVWYDSSEVTVRPDHSENVIAAYDRYEANGDALRREIGLDEGDRPNDEELRTQALKKLLNHPTAAELAARELGIISDDTTTIKAKGENDPGEDVGGAPPSAEAPGAPVNGPPNNGQPPSAATLEELVAF